MYEKKFISAAIESLDPEKVEQLAIASGFQSRKPRKITPLELLHIYCLESVGKSPSYNDLAGIISDSTGDAPSRQAVGKRINEKFVVFLKMVLEEAISEKTLDNTATNRSVYSCFSRIVVQDSTILKLPMHLFEEFSGVANAHTSVCNARIQGVYDLIGRRFLSFSIDKYSKNDLKSAPELDIDEKDLVLRDRGYLKFSEIKRIQDHGAFHIHRHLSSVIYRYPETGAEIDLAAELQKNKSLDMDVCLNDDSKTMVRLVAVPVDEEIANKRRMKAKKEDKGHSPSKKLLFLMSWTIYITNLPRETFKAEKIWALYGLRWRIENIFKTWKSNMSFADIHNVSYNQLHSMLQARLITIVIIMHRVYRPCAEVIANHSNYNLSMAKLMRHIQVKTSRLMTILEGIAMNVKKTAFSLIRSCSYDKRKRLNYNQKENMILNEISLS